MNLAQSTILPPPASRFIFTPIPPPPPPSPVPPGPDSYRMKVLQFLDQVGGEMAFGKAVHGVLFHEIQDALGERNTLGATLHRMRRKGFVESTGGLKQARYRLTSAGRAAVADLRDEE